MYRGTHRILVLSTVPFVGWGSSVGTGTHFGLDGPGIEFRWGRDLVGMLCLVLLVLMVEAS